MIDKETKMWAGKSVFFIAIMDFEMVSPKFAKVLCILKF